ncbi:MAG: hypothetical protein AB2L09_08425 [Coriobacteriia bacterium]
MDLAFIPKSNVRLHRGDYALLPRPDGRFAVLVYLAPVGNMRSAFWGALLNVVLPGDRLPPEGVLPILDMALIHISLFVKASVPVVGNINDRLDQNDVSRRLEETHERNLLWGWQTVLRRASEIPA